MTKNKYCDTNSLRNEADVEQNFVRRWLADLGYSDRQILPKHSLKSLNRKAMRGHPKENYRPDFALRANRKIRWIVEAKSPAEKIKDHEWQPREYTIWLNGADKKENPVRYFLVTNGLFSNLYDPNLNDPILSLKFSDFAAGNTKFDQLLKILSADTIQETQNDLSTPIIKLEKKTFSEINAAFSWCHQHIYRKDEISQSEAFIEFVKLIALKLLSDRAIKSKYPAIISKDSVDVPITDVDFSEHWIDINERNSHNPMSEIQFRSFMNSMEGEIARGERKRIFEPNDQIKLKPETIKGVARRLETYFLFGIDADLNGRLFETFLNATMRGKDLGQFFTPRSLVALGVKLSRLEVHVSKSDHTFHTDTVIDACCGTGGFLIDALSDMWEKCGRRALSQTEQEALKKEIANNHIIGIDVANAPILARIARLNMYLHGDGGSRIFHLNALDKSLEESIPDNPDIIKEKAELKRLILDGGIDVALTNPPFAKAMDRGTDEEARILDDYEISKQPGSKKDALRSCLLFIERYRDLLKPGGRLVTIIDDGILSGREYRWFRDILREWFIIRAVISLPGDAFQRSNARVKTSFLLLEKRLVDTVQDQPAVFMYPCLYVGIDDPKRQRERPGDAELRSLAKEEIATVMQMHEAFLRGEGGRYRVEPKRISDRLDVKNCLFDPGEQIKKWRSAGFKVIALSDALYPREYSDEEIVLKDSAEIVTPYIVRYDGSGDRGEEFNSSDSTYARLYPVFAGDLVISNIAASYGSVAVVSAEYEGCIVSSEYTVLRCHQGYSPHVMQRILRSPEIRAEILLSASGANRTRIRWELVKSIQVPYPSAPMVKRVADLVESAKLAQEQALVATREATNLIEHSLSLSSEHADEILSAFKPPK